MANKVKVTGYSKKTTYNFDTIEYRNFSPDSVGVQLASLNGTPLFTMGNFSITTNMDPKTDKNYVTGNYSNFITLETLNLSVEETKLLLKNNINTSLNLNSNELKNYALFGSMTEYIRTCLEDIITNWPASLFASPFVSIKGQDYVGSTYENYSYDALTNESNFKVNTTFLINQFQLNYLSNGTILDTFNEANDLRNVTINYESYAIKINNIEYDVLGFTGSTYNINDYIYFKVKGNPFTGNTTEGNFYYHIKPKKIIENTFFNGLKGLQKFLLNRNSSVLYTATFNFPVRNDEGVIMYTSKSVTWPVTDGYNINFDTNDYVSYAEELLNIATNYDLNETNLMNRFLVSESISAFDTVPVHLADVHQDTTTGQKVNKTLNIYGRSFDDINQFIDGVSLAHTVTYDKQDNTPDKYLKDLARILGWDVVSTLVSDDLLNNYVTTSESSFSGVSVGLTPIEKETELWRRLILNSPWVWKSKGARKSVEFLLNFMGIPKGLVRFNEYVYKADSPIDIDLFIEILDKNGLDTDLTLYPVDSDGFPKPLTNTQDMYFQNYGLWYRETGGSGSTIDILTGNNPHAGPYDGGSKYINQFRKLIPNFSAVTLNTETSTSTQKNLFLNYAQGQITNYNGDTYVDIVGSDNSDIGNCIVYQAEIIGDPMPTPILTPCDCPCEGEDDILSVCVEKGKPINQPCKTLINTPSVNSNTGFYVANVNTYAHNGSVIGTKTTSYIDTECCTALGGISVYMDSEYDGAVSSNPKLWTNGYVCCKTQECGCNVACKWGLIEVNKVTNAETFLPPIEIPVGSGNYFLQFSTFYGLGNRAVVTPDGSNCIDNYTTPVSNITDPYTNKTGFGCRLTTLGMGEMANGVNGILFEIFSLRQKGLISCCQRTYSKSLYE